jgi:Protein of unknown function (DUF3099)
VRRETTATSMKQQSITTLPPSPEAERRARMIKYTIAMSIRAACIFAMLFAQGWWLVVFAAGAVFLPYVAVVLANVSGPTRNQTVLRPGGIVPVGPSGPGDDAPGSGTSDGPATATDPADADGADPEASGTAQPGPTGTPADSNPRPDDERGAA